MIPELGQFALIVALCIALAQAVLPLAGAARGNVAWMSVARPAAQGQFVFIAIAFACLAYSFVSNDFSVLNVATNSNSSLPWFYRFAATWGSHEGSLLLWVLMLTVWMLAVSVFSRHLPLEMVARILGVMALISIGFLLFMLFTSNPFQRLLPAAPDGNDLNPLLQDPGMVIHPPMLYMGYVGFSVAFAFAIAALLGGKLDATWARWSRPWTTMAWVFLTVGIALGSGWAYYELGWGGWWFWDPVENASFMPWLVGTALMHSLAVTEKRGGFRVWTVLLAIIAFSLSLLGTFLVRSGVLTSVHAFATDPARGVFILLFLVIVIGGSLILFAWRAPRVGLGGSFEHGDAIAVVSFALNDRIVGQTQLLDPDPPALREEIDFARMNVVKVLCADADFFSGEKLEHEFGIAPADVAVVKAAHHVAAAENLGFEVLAARAQLQQAMDQDFHRKHAVAGRCTVAAGIRAVIRQHEMIHATYSVDGIANAGGHARSQHGHQHHVLAGDEILPRQQLGRRQFVAGVKIGVARNRIAGLIMHGRWPVSGRPPDTRSGRAGGKDRWHVAGFRNGPRTADHPNPEPGQTA